MRNEAFAQLSRTERLVRRRHELTPQQKSPLQPVATETNSEIASTPLPFPVFYEKRPKRSWESGDILGAPSNKFPDIPTRGELWQEHEVFSYRRDGRLSKNARHSNMEKQQKVILSLERSITR